MVVTGIVVVDVVGKAGWAAALAPAAVVGGVGEPIAVALGKEPEWRCKWQWFLKWRRADVCWPVDEPFPEDVRGFEAVQVTHVYYERGSPVHLEIAREGERELLALIGAEILRPEDQPGMPELLHTLVGKTLYLESDESQADYAGLKHKALHRYAWLEDGRMLNLELLKSGAARLRERPLGRGLLLTSFTSLGGDEAVPYKYKAHLEAAVVKRDGPGKK